MSPSDFKTDDFEVWPENMPAIHLLSFLSTQWRVMPVGGKVGCIYTGLDYNVMYRKMDRMKLSESEYDNLEDDMRVIESEAMTILNKKD